MPGGTSGLSLETFSPPCGWSGPGPAWQQSTGPVGSEAPWSTVSQTPRKPHGSGGQVALLGPKGNLLSAQEAALQDGAAGIEGLHLNGFSLCIWIIIITLGMDVRPAFQKLTAQ